MVARRAAARAITMPMTTVITTTVTLSPILMPALHFCVVPLVTMATMARMRAGMVQKREKKNVTPQQTNVMMDSTSAATAIPVWSSSGGG